MKKSKELRDMSVYEASEFWDEHDFSEFGDIAETQEVRFSLKKKKYVGVDSKLYTKIRSVAKKYNVTEDALINKWLKEKAGA